MELCQNLGMMAFKIGRNALVAEQPSQLSTVQLPVDPPELPPQLPDPPLEPLPRLSAALGGPRLWAKREDCTGFGLGGNKLRKLDFVLAEAQDARQQVALRTGRVLLQLGRRHAVEPW